MQPADSSLQSKISLPVLVAVAGVRYGGGSPNDLPVAIVHRKDHKGFPLVRNHTSDILFKNKDDQFRTSAMDRANG